MALPSPKLPRPKRSFPVSRTQFPAIFPVLDWSLYVLQRLANIMASGASNLGLVKLLTTIVLELPRPFRRTSKSSWTLPCTVRHHLGNDGEYFTTLPHFMRGSATIFPIAKGYQVISWEKEQSDYSLILAYLCYTNTWDWICRAFINFEVYSRRLSDFIRTSLRRWFNSEAWSRLLYSVPPF